MRYTRRRTWPLDPHRQDYVIRCAGRDIGRVYLKRLADGRRYFWLIYMNGPVPQVEGVPISGHAVTLDKADAALRRAYEAMRAKAGLPRPQR
jgi:hypothetical protein